jgi:SAM-dependent methyltransferase
VAMRDKMIRVANGVLKHLGLEIRSRLADHSLSFDTYVHEAAKAGLDVNDYLEQIEGWEPAEYVIKKFVAPYRGDASTVIEIGPGSGRHARFLLPRHERDQLHLFDNSLWMQRFLKEYFRVQPTVKVHDFCRDYQLEFPAEQADIVFSNGTFIALKLGEIREFALEAFRVLRPGGCFVFDYLDLSREEGWKYLQSQPSSLAACYTYFMPETIDRLCIDAGFHLRRRDMHGKSVFVNFVKH